MPWKSLEQCLSKKSLLYDKNGEEHYNLISALHKSMRNSDPDAAVYWLARMLEAGRGPALCRAAPDPLCQRGYRPGRQPCPRDRPGGLPGVPLSRDAGMQRTPDARRHLPLAAPHSNAVYTAYEAAKRDALNMLDEPVPLVIRNAPTGLMKDLGYGDGYIYAHDAENKLAELECLPESLRGRHYHVPTEQRQRSPCGRAAGTDRSLARRAPQAPGKRIRRM